MSGYVAPAEAPVSSSWADHRNRQPPSAEPGTDYATAYGTPCRAAGAGRIADRMVEPNGGTGRFVTLDLDDGRRVRYLHLKSVNVSVGQRVERGQVIAHTGASGYGSDWYYGAHVHVTLFPRQNYDFSSTIDFELYVGDDTPPPPEKPEDDEMPMRGMNYERASDGQTIRVLFDTASGWYSEVSGISGDYVNNIAKYWETGSWPTLTESHAGAIKRDLDKLRTRSVDLTDIPPASRSARIGWTVFAVLLAIGIVAGVWLGVLPR